MVTVPVDAAVVLWVTSTVMIPVPVLIRLTAFGVASLKRLIWPEKVVLALLKPTVSVWEFATLLNTEPLPANDPHTVAWPLRFSEVPAPRFRSEKREPLLKAPDRMLPALTFNAPVKVAWLICRTPAPFLVMPPDDPSKPPKMSPGVVGAKLVKVLKL